MMCNVIFIHKYVFLGYFYYLCSVTFNIIDYAATNKRGMQD